MTESRKKRVKKANKRNGAQAGDIMLLFGIKKELKPLNKSVLVNHLLLSIFIDGHN